MARTNRMKEEEQDLNLAPIMNMVIILIPLLLLSVVFLKVGVINITAPKLSVGPPSAEPPDEDKKPLNLTVAVSASGFRIGAEGGVLPARGGCPPDGPTICLAKKDVDVSGRFSDARTMMAAGDISKGEKVMEQGLQAYDWRELYNALSKIKTEFPDETVVNLSADPDIPFSAIVRTMDVIRYKLQKDSFDSDADFWGSKPKEKTAEGGKKGFDELFSDPVLAVAQ
jgi:biopolymer transport protein ExbD